VGLEELGQYRFYCVADDVVMGLLVEANFCAHGCEFGFQVGVSVGGQEDYWDVAGLVVGFHADEGLEAAYVWCCDVHEHYVWRPTGTGERDVAAVCGLLDGVAFVV
jgi:hypothetical protein